MRIKGVLILEARSASGNKLGGGEKINGHNRSRIIEVNRAGEMNIRNRLEIDLVKS